MTPKKKIAILTALMLVMLGTWGFFEKLRNQRFQDAVQAAAKKSIQQNIVVTMAQGLSFNPYLREIVIQAILDSCEIEVRERRPLNESQELISYEIKVLSADATKELLKVTLDSLEQKKVLNENQIKEVIKNQIDSKYPKQVIVNRMTLQNHDGRWEMIEQP
ncbi:hypothetical protein [Bdellovibrio svalbardensis]|uniref:DUF4878 domain-containing protein n=1 Tax=Bdellovibrio svalbardensis TaxID=2972972 RepID=A0ABT6DNT5_9BACT|nr:hypothetical protein [Bdellovibrio svalbardensis]MDG0817501.1 hypothetical protein [Bdellovibrio svalbardensis]